MAVNVLSTADISDQLSAPLISVYRSKRVFRTIVHLRILAQTNFVQMLLQNFQVILKLRNWLPALNLYAAYISLKIEQNDKSGETDVILHRLNSTWDP